MANLTHNRLVIEIEDFISKVQAKRCLWDQKDPNYYKRDYQRVAWMEIADDTHAPVHELKKRWRGLRDTFCRELRKMDSSLSDEELAASSPWRHFNCLIFLRDVVSSMKKPRKRLILDVRKESGINDGSDNGEDDNANISDRSSSPDSGHQDPLTTEIIVKREPELFPAAPSREQELRSAQENALAVVDSDAQFLMSLLPFLQDVPKRRKLVVRARLAQVLAEEQPALDGH